MYPDPKRVRNNRIMLRLDDYEHDLVAALANYQGESVATIARIIIMREAAAVLASDNNASLPRNAG
ncbi:hypothetical protein [Janthinobacterium fluminis]|uniref:CopG family transcriptional regulator n=1 Tax=Janthinobacterium fluminis TaxID=2987524 RepID=A0ABT5JXM4_9BURK|nr:hypothetical protein [Janthinobacterium fluminis]MDC8757493.1 hypothetical protein [Janthinobacterium fluminis]